MTQGRKIPGQGDASVQGSLDRLLLCNRIRELVDYSAPVMTTSLSRAHRMLASVAGLSQSSIGIWRRTLIYPFVIVLLRLLLYRWRIWRLIPSTIFLIYVRVCHRQPSPSEITGYALSSDKETPLIRACLLLRAMRRYGVCIEFLMRRFNSGLPDAETRHWLSFFLREVGDTEVADIISPATGHREATELEPSLNVREQLSPEGSRSPRLKYGLVMLTMFDSDVFRSSLLSLLGSDFPGEIVVVEEGNQPERVCRSFCQQLPVRYVKNPKWSGVSGAANLGIEQLAPETDIVIYTHNDVLWPQHWFGQLNSAWERVYDPDRVGIINLGYMQFSRYYTDDVLYHLFVRGGYEDLVWILRAMRDIPSLMGMVKDVQSEDMGRLFGLARDDWGTDLTKLRMMTGRFSVGASFPLRTWRNIGGFNPDISTGLQMELQYYCFQNWKWNLWMNNTPLIHMRSTDLNSLTGEGLEFFWKNIWETYDAFPEKYGWEIEHLLSTYYGETSIIYQDEIINAANDLRFSDVDFVFDDFWGRLEGKRLDNCELVWCRSRDTCHYRSSADTGKVRKEGLAWF